MPGCATRAARSLVVSELRSRLLFCQGHHLSEKFSGSTLHCKGSSSEDDFASKRRKVLIPGLRRREPSKRAVLLCSNAVPLTFLSFATSCTSSVWAEDPRLYKKNHSVLDYATCYTTPAHHSRLVAQWEKGSIWKQHSKTKIW